MTSKDYQQFKLNLPKRLFDHLKRSASQNNRSLTAEIITWLEASIPNEDPEALRTTRETPPTGVRLPDAVRNQIKQQAASNKRSMNSEIIILLQEALTAREITASPPLSIAEPFDA